MLYYELDFFFFKKKEKKKKTEKKEWAREKKPLQPLVNML